MLPSRLESDLIRIVVDLLPNDRANVRRIQYASPGLTDIAGVGVIVGHIKEFLIRAIEFGAPSERLRRQLENIKRGMEIEELETKRQADRLQNAKAMIDIAERLSYSESEITKLVSWVDERQETFIRLAAQGKLRGVRLLDEEGSKTE